MPFCGCGQTFAHLFDNLDCAAAGFEEIDARCQVIQVKRLVATDVGVCLDWTAAQVIDGVCAFLLSDSILSVGNGKLQFL